MHQSTAIVLLSGGLDSLLAALLADSERHKRWRGPVSDPLTVLSVDYGQGTAELACAAVLAREYRWHHVRATVSPLPGSLDPTGTNLRPGRNQLFLALAAGLLPAEGGQILIGSNADDQVDYPDCRPAFFTAFEALQAAQGRKIAVRAPLVNLSKAEIVGQLIQRGALLDWTVSCYAYDGQPCEVCNACKLRAAALKAHGR